MLKKGSIAVIVLLGLGVMAFKTGIDGAPENNSKKEITLVGAYEPIVVLELFTSQGCSSCPAADLLLEKSKKQFADEVFALSYHVDYWNYIGWEDPFSKSSFSKKQREYNLKFRNRSNYTPQMVVNGREHFVGSNGTQMSRAIERYTKERSENRLNAKKVAIEGEKVTLTFTVDGPKASKNLRALLVLDERVTAVKRGENRNRTLKNSNIVVAEKTVPLDSEEGAITLSIPDIVKSNEKISLITLVEDEKYNITAAVKRSLERR